MQRYVVQRSAMQCRCNVDALMAACMSCSIRRPYTRDCTAQEENPSEKIHPAQHISRVGVTAGSVLAHRPRGSGGHDAFLPVRETVGASAPGQTPGWTAGTIHGGTTMDHESYVLLTISDRN